MRVFGEIAVVDLKKPASKVVKNKISIELAAGMDLFLQPRFHFGNYFFVRIGEQLAFR
jgi:hypothetical protein